jgi:flavin-dependent dehydrogenase
MEALRDAGVEIERGVELTGISSDDDSVLVSLRRSNGTEEQFGCTYLAGCDGARSSVRERTNIGLPGGTYSHLWYVADVDASGPLTNQEVNISMDSRDVIAVFPMKGNGSARLVGQASADGNANPKDWASVNQRLLVELQTNVRKVRWFSTYRVHHRVAEAFRRGRIFLLGDAAHLHSPVGGQGMNTGIGDAVNLAWKLSAVLRGRSAPELLNSYEPERMTFARGLVASTDRVFGMLNSRSGFAAFFRTVLAPIAMPWVTRYSLGRRFAFRLLSQISVNYRRSLLSAGSTASVRGGDRLPWVNLIADRDGYPDNFAPLDSMTWQIHVYGIPAPQLHAVCAAHRLTLHAFTWHSAMTSAGLRRNALYLVRPDEHVAFTDPNGDIEALNRYLAASPAFSVAKLTA